MAVKDYKMKWRDTNYREDRRQGSRTPFETMARDGSSAQRTLFCAWDKRQQATKDFLGETQRQQVGEYIYPLRKVPNYHPDFTTAPYFDLPDLKVPYLYAETIQHEGFLADKDTPKSILTDTDGGAVSNFKESQMTVKYESTPYVVLDDDQFTQAAGVGDISVFGNVDESCCLRYVWGKLISAPKYQTLPAIDTLSWALDNAPITTTAVVILCEGDLLLKWFNIPLALFDRALVESVIGKTNRDPFGHELSPVGIYPKGTLVFVSPDVEPFRRATGEIYLDVTYRFKYYPNGANKFYRVDTDSDGGTRPGGGTERANGNGFYWATRPYNGRAVPEGDISTLPAGINVLLFPFGDFKNLFRGREDKSDETLLDG